MSRPIAVITTTRRPGAPKAGRRIARRRHRGVLSPNRCKALANRFLTEVQGVVATSEIYGAAHDALFNGYFANLKQYQQPDDFGIGLGLLQLPRPRPLQIFVDPVILYGFFRLWLRKQKIDPNTVVHPDWEFHREDDDTESRATTNYDDV